jgi:hypothetical protein
MRFFQRGREHSFVMKRYLAGGPYAARGCRTVT